MKRGMQSRFPSMCMLTKQCAYLPGPPYSDSSRIFLLHRYVHLPAVLTEEELAREIDPVPPCEP